MKTTTLPLLWIELVTVALPLGLAFGLLEDSLIYVSCKLLGIG